MQFIDTVVGGQYGSEAKGHVTAQLIKGSRNGAEQFPDVAMRIINVRVAGPNAGHTAYDDNGNKFAFRQLPIGAIADSACWLYIAPGSEVDLDVLYKEIREAEEAGHQVKERLYVSRQATLLTEDHKLAESIQDLTGKVGSTGKGIGAARADRIMRRAKTLGQFFGENQEFAEETPWAWAEPEDLYATDEITTTMNTHVIIEGTQGYGLGLHTENYPYVTSSDCRASDFWAMAGINPLRRGVARTITWVVARVHPIRVAGNSGPLKGETTWDELGLQPEYTTVTQKVRRVGGWDPDLVKAAVQANGGASSTAVVITMLDQVIPELSVLEPGEPFTDEGIAALDKAEKWLSENASPEMIGTRVGAITFSPTKMLFIAQAVEENGEVDFEMGVR